MEGVRVVYFNGSSLSSMALASTADAAALARRAAAAGASGASRGGVADWQDSLGALSGVLSPDALAAVDDAHAALAAAGPHGSASAGAATRMVGNSSVEIDPLEKTTARRPAFCGCCLWPPTGLAFLCGTGRGAPQAHHGAQL